MVHHWSTERNIFTSIGQVAIKSCMDNHGPQRMNQVDFGGWSPDFTSSKTCSEFWFIQYDISYMSLACLSAFSWFPDNESYWLWWSPDIPSGTTMRFTFVVTPPWVLVLFVSNHTTQCQLSFTYWTYFQYKCTNDWSMCKYSKDFSKTC